MASGGMEQDGAPIGEFVGRLIDDGKDYAKAEFNLARLQAEAEVKSYRMVALLAVGAGALALTALITLFLTISLALATLIGPLAGGLVATLLATGAAVGLAQAARKKMDSRK